MIPRKLSRGLIAKQSFELLRLASVCSVLRHDTLPMFYQRTLFHFDFERLIPAYLNYELYWHLLQPVIPVMLTHVRFSIIVGPASAPSLVAMLDYISHSTSLKHLMVELRPDLARWDKTEQVMRSGLLAATLAILKELQTRCQVAFYIVDREKFELSRWQRPGPTSPWYDELAKELEANLVTLAQGGDSVQKVEAVKPE